MKLAKKPRLIITWRNGSDTGKNVLMVDYEKLIMDSELEMKRIADFIGIPFHSFLLKLSKLGIEVRVPTNRTGEEKIVSRHSLEKWKKRTPDSASTIRS
ncbi:MAG: sulfotransferase domain-containing protein [Deltaproteobacteria bacterium]|nr:sulfotransferase domain-containing protein [Deltaproteobacteria bacterium]